MAPADFGAAVDERPREQLSIGSAPDDGSRRAARLLLDVRRRAARAKPSYLAAHFRDAESAEFTERPQRTTLKIGGALARIANGAPAKLGKDISSNPIACVLRDVRTPISLTVRSHRANT
jgi:hypothetical protein